jgi:hypothetical protein
MAFETELEDELELELFQPHAEAPEDPFPWPTGRTFNPPPGQIIPAGPFQTSATCEAVLTDFGKLTLAVGDLKNLLTKTPPDINSIENRANIITSLARQIVERFKALFYKEQACTREDLSAFASSLNVMRGPGGDADVGSWPRATTAAAQEARRQARESLRHLLDWARRAAREYPRI